MTSESVKTRRRYGRQFKAMVLAQCDEPGMSVAQVAMSHGINDNVVHRWRQLARQQAAPQRAKPSLESAPLLQNVGFVPVALPSFRGRQVNPGPKVLNRDWLPPPPARPCARPCARIPYHRPPRPNPRSMSMNHAPRSLLLSARWQHRF